MHYDFAAKFLLSLRGHVDEFSCSRGEYDNLTWAIRYAINETGLFEKDFIFALKLTLESPEVDEICAQGYGAGLIKPITRNLEGATFSRDLVGYKFVIAKDAAERELKSMGEDQQISTLVEKVVESLQNPLVNPSLPRAR